MALTKEENDYLCRVGPGTPMGHLLRRYWLPVEVSSELPAPDCPPVRVRVLGEDLIAFRDTNGSVGLIEAHCAHRGMDLFYGRNEECGLRCVYHGWKYDVSGQCVDMPNEPAENDFKHTVRLTAYPTVESAGLVWAYMGPKAKQPPFREFMSHYIPKQEWAGQKVVIYCNYMQVNEGNIDSSHVSFLHRDFTDTQPIEGGTPLGYPTSRMTSFLFATSRVAKIEVEDTPWGFRYAAIRPTAEGHQHVRISQHILPNISYIPGPLPTQGLRGGFIQVPMDDENTLSFRFGRLPGDPGYGRTLLPDNDYLIDRERQRSVSFTGIQRIEGAQDRAATEGMGRIYDRTRERLGSTDEAIIRLRQTLIKSARDLEQGIDPPALDPSIQYHRIRPEEKIIPTGMDWRTLATDADPDYRELVPEGPPDYAEMNARAAARTQRVARP